MVNQHHVHLESYSGVRVLLLGASGFIGRWVAKKLGEKGATTFLLVRDRKGAQRMFSQYKIPGTILKVDVCNTPEVVDTFRAIRPSITFNLCGYGVDQSERDEKTSYQINAELVKVICEGLEKGQDPNWSGQDIVHVGSAGEYGVVGGDLSEESIPKPTTIYGQSKLLGTQLLEKGCRDFGLKGITARLFTVYGPGEHSHRLLPSLIDAARTGKFLSLTAGTQKRDFTYVEDVADGLLRLGLSATKKGEVFNLATGTLTSVSDFAKQAALILGISANKLSFGSLPIRTDEMYHSEVSLLRIKRAIGWIPSTKIDQGIQKTHSF